MLAENQIETGVVMDDKDDGDQKNNNTKKERSWRSHACQTQEFRHSETLYQTIESAADHTRVYVNI